MLQCGFVRANLALPIAAASYQQEEHKYARATGAGDGNRTHVASLEGWSSTIELHPPVIPPAPLGLLPQRDNPARGAGGGGRIRTYVGIRRQIYSLLPLTTRPPLRIREARGPRIAGDRSFTLDCQHAEAQLRTPNRPHKGPRRQPGNTAPPRPAATRHRRAPAPPPPARERRPRRLAGP